MTLRILPRPTEAASNLSHSAATVTPIAFASRGPPCKTCRHAERNAIDLALIGGESLRSIADRFGLTHSSVGRHKRNCVPGDILQAHHAKKIADADFLLARLCELERFARRLMATAEAKGDLRSALAAISEHRRLIEVQARMAMRNHGDTVTSSVASEAITELVNTILGTLDDDDTRIKLANALSPLTAKPAG
jgi:hypothetical protein